MTDKKRDFYYPIFQVLLTFTYRMVLWKGNELCKSPDRRRYQSFTLLKIWGKRGLLINIIDFYNELTIKTNHQSKIKIITEGKKR